MANDTKQRTQAQIDSDNCACGGTLAVPSYGADADDNGYAACPDCTARFPHKVSDDINTEATCEYCGMYYPDGACPALSHPARAVQS